MYTIAEIMDQIVPITQFNKGQASKIFERVKTLGQVLVLKNNAPAAVILSPEEYRRLIDAEEDLMLLAKASERMQGDWMSRTIPHNEFLMSVGLDPDDPLDDVEVEFE